MAGRVTVPERRGLGMMSIYSVVLFIHVVSAIGLFVAFAGEGAILFRIRSARSAEEARFFIGVFHRLRVIAIPAFLGILVGGMFLTLKYGGGTFWIPSALGATLLIMFVGGIVTGRKMSRLRSAFSKPEVITSFDPVVTGIRDSALVFSYGLRSGLAVGIVFLMTAKPLLPLSLTALVVASIAGVFIARGGYLASNRNGADCGAGSHLRNPIAIRPD
jgi:hypothetical protein